MLTDTGRQNLNGGTFLFLGADRLRSAGLRRPARDAAGLFGGRAWHGGALGIGTGRAAGAVGPGPRGSTQPDDELRRCGRCPGAAPADAARGTQQRGRPWLHLPRASRARQVRLDLFILWSLLVFTGH